MSTTEALIAPTAGATLERSIIHRRELGPHDVLIDIAYSGICHSDIHQVRDEWGGAIFPMVPGHEITGTVAAIGSDATRHAVGDRVGVGVFVDSCRECGPCLAGDEQFCLRGNIPTYNGRDFSGEVTYGGYSKQIVTDERYVLRIPDALALDVAAPLLCAGITTYSPLRRWGAGPGKKVAVVGMGGLGHVAVKIAHALGAHVTVISQTRSKEEDGLRLGGDRYVALSEPTGLSDVANEFDLIINTVSADVDVDALASTLNLGGTLVFVGLPEAQQSFSVGTLVFSGRSISGSYIGSIRQTQEMLDFCAENGIGAEIETITADDVDAAYERVIASKVRYRFVIDAATI